MLNLNSKQDNNELMVMPDLDPVDKWLTETFPDAEQTQKRQNNKVFFEEFLALTGKSAQQIINEHKTLHEKQFKDTYEQMLLAYTKRLQKNLPAHQVKEHVDIVRAFFAYYKLPLPFGLRAHVQFLVK
jgi:hypothetical protein